jgi:hypothetical protein
MHVHMDITESPIVPSLTLDFLYRVLPYLSV